MAQAERATINRASEAAFRHHPSLLVSRWPEIGLRATGTIGPLATPLQSFDSRLLACLRTTLDAMSRWRQQWTHAVGGRRRGQDHPGRCTLLEYRVLAKALADAASDRAGVRLSIGPNLGPLLSQGGPIGEIRPRMSSKEKAQRSVYCSHLWASTRRHGQNWKLGWHQDRTIAVESRVEVEGFGPWSKKNGVQHVEPPFALLEKMITLRVHLDAVGHDNGPLLIAPGSHRLGRISIRDVQEVVARCGTYACHAEVGDVWMYSTPILHASNVAAMPSHRRVLQVDYAATNLPGGLKWVGLTAP